MLTDNMLNLDHSTFDLCMAGAMGVFLTSLLIGCCKYNEVFDWSISTSGRVVYSVQGRELGRTKMSIL